MARGYVEKSQFVGAGLYYKKDGGLVFYELECGAPRKLVRVSRGSPS